MKAVCFDGKIVDLKPNIKVNGDTTVYSLPKDFDYSNIELIKFDCFGVVATSDTEGYAVFPRSERGCDDFSLFMFDKHRDDFYRKLERCIMPVFGVKTEEKCFLAVISGMIYDYYLEVEIKNGECRICPVFEVNGENPYEDFEVSCFSLFGDDANYSGMARRYRKYRSDKGEITPIKERMKESETLRYSVSSVNVRIRCGWKPAPAKVLHQTLSNEPEMKVACDFDRVGDILDEFKEKGVKKAEICLVGWNVKGHDGRWPQMFPVCEELGGEDKLKKLIKKAQNMGYQITCHTNSTDQYEIADCYDPQNTRLDRFLNPVKDSVAWSGGEMNQLCPKIAYENTKKFLPKVSDLGFKGTHYIDVLGTVYPRRCYNKNHYVNSKDSVYYASQIAKISKNLFGGFSSEGGYDYIAPYLDFALYICFSPKEDEICDKRIPFWQIVYHGYMLYNPYSATVNPNYKGRYEQLKLIEYGGRPSYYYYSAFMNNGNNWMGSKDALCRTKEELEDSAKRIKRSYEEYEKLCYLQTEFMEKHEEVSKNVFEVTYSDGTVIRVDYNSETYEVKRK